MPCDKCREKLKAKGVITASIVPDKYKDPTESAGLSKAKVDRSTKLGNPYKPRPCKICDKEILEGHYCPTCSYKKGICNLCGKRIVNTTTEYRSTNA